MGNILWSIVWLILIVFIAWPVAGFLGFFYVFLQPFNVCLKLDDLEEVLVKFMDLPYTWALHLVNGDPVFK